MIYIEMNGRLGNQMFRYAFGRWLQYKAGRAGKSSRNALVLDFSNIEMESKRSSMPGWEDSLAHFRTAPYTRWNGKGSPLRRAASLPEQAVLGLIWAGDRFFGRGDTVKRLRWRKKFLPWLNRHGLYILFVGYDYDFTLSRKRDKFVNGPFECARYCEEIRPLLLKEFRPKYPTAEKNAALMEQITSVNSVCVTIRRGNYLEYPMLDVCGADYFERAMAEMKKLVEDPVFFLFSDDVDWVKENVRVPGKAVYESGDDPVWEKLRLMYSCRHFIISNSTFSWWAQFLGDAKDKVVIAPDHWFNAAYQPPPAQKNWIRAKA